MAKRTKLTKSEIKNVIKSIVNEQSLLNEFSPLGTLASAIRKFKNLSSTEEAISILKSMPHIVKIIDDMCRESKNISGFETLEKQILHFFNPSDSPENTKITKENMVRFLNAYARIKGFKLWPDLKYQRFPSNKPPEKPSFKKTSTQWGDFKTWSDYGNNDEEEEEEDDVEGHEFTLDFTVFEHMMNEFIEDYNMRDGERGNWLGNITELTIKILCQLGLFGQVNNKEVVLMIKYRINSALIDVAKVRYPLPKQYSYNERIEIERLRRKYIEDNDFARHQLDIAIKNCWVRGRIHLGYKV